MKGSVHIYTLHDNKNIVSREFTRIHSSQICISQRSYSYLLEDEPLRRASIRTLQGDLKRQTHVVIHAIRKKDIPYHVLFINTRSNSPEKISRRKFDLVNRIGFQMGGGGSFCHFVILNLEETKRGCCLLTVYRFSCVLL